MVYGVQFAFLLQFELVSKINIPLKNYTSPSSP